MNHLSAPSVLPVVSGREVKPLPVLTGPAPHLGGRGSVCEGALVTGADYRGLGIVRSLGRRRIRVWVLRSEDQRLGTVSRYAHRSLAWPAGEDEDCQLAFLLELAKQEGLAGWVLFPTTDEAVDLISHRHEALSEWYRLTTPPWEVLRWGCDKLLLSSLARHAGVDTPWTICPRNREELATLDCPFPVILKPAMRLGFNRFTRDKAWRVDNRRSLLARYDEACKLLDPGLIMVQEMLPGWGESQYSYAALCQAGSPLASVVARRVRQFPMEFGRFSTYVETVDEPRVEAPAVRLLAALRFTGLVELEFKRDPRDAKFKVIDLNPRVWGWHSVCARAGVDFPFLAWMQSRRKEVPEARGRPGEHWMRVGADFAMAIHEFLRGRLPLHTYLKSLRNSVECSMFAWDDPLPGLLSLPLFAVAAGRRLLHGSLV